MHSPGLDLVHMQFVLEVVDNATLVAIRCHGEIIPMLKAPEFLTVVMWVLGFPVSAQRLHEHSGSCQPFR